MLNPIKNCFSTFKSMVKRFLARHRPGILQVPPHRTIKAHREEYLKMAADLLVREAITPYLCYQCTLHTMKFHARAIQMKDMPLPCAIVGEKGNAFSVWINPSDTVECAQEEELEDDHIDAKDVKLFLAKKNGAWLAEEDMNKGVKETGLAMLGPVGAPPNLIEVSEEDVQFQPTKNDVKTVKDGNALCAWWWFQRNLHVHRNFWVKF
ncbi:hypothetical protein PHMEG_00033037 [Phytophthora megakarya]|uniref:Crinkler effector protein N-terminal domain-containing protein n=1 Tax=Phytophthora megakarya TaxID=4795 RepID=A0A225UUU4_9STRA|nr:hypothetical protein PHMEG_00033037 [Phytophthora megakarya]